MEDHYRYDKWEVQITCWCRISLTVTNDHRSTKHYLLYSGFFPIEQERVWSLRVSHQMMSCPSFFTFRSSTFNWLEATNEDENEPLMRTIPKAPVLLEIVGAMGLATRTRKNVDPYCVVRMGEDDKEVHRTKTIYDDGNPIWTIKTKSLCLLAIPHNEVARNTDSTEDVVNIGRATVSVFHGYNCLGRVNVSYDELLYGDGERKEFSISSKRSTAILALRYRLATPEDIQFLKESPGEKSSRLEGLASDVNFHSVARPSIFQMYRKFKNKKEYFRVLPFPDPERPKETKWMTRDEIIAESLKPSKSWVSAGQGKTGKIFLEILGCDELPEMDINVNDHTDAFVGVVLEDTMVRTDVIWDELSPRWMPWTTRAFELRVQHPSSILMLGVFDYDEMPVDYHDPVGRVVINTTNFRCNTEYMLHYKLTHDPREEDDEPRGTITIRLRIEWENESEAMKISFKPAPRFIINVNNDKSYQVLRYITRGAVDMEKASIDSVQLYANELLSSWKNFCYLLDVLMEVWLWRGRLQVTKNRSIWFPVDSFVLLVAVAMLVERPSLVLPITLYGIAWALLSVNYRASRHPYPWKRVKKSEEINMMALLGRSRLRSEKIEAGQGLKEGMEVDRLDELKAERMAALIQAVLRAASIVYGTYSKTNESSIVMATQTKNWSFLENRLHHLHMILKLLCMKFRLVRNFINWKSYSTDAFTTNCIMIATLWLIFPVNTLAHWILRILTWTLLGPWLKLVDIFWVHSWYETDDELMERVRSGDVSNHVLPDLHAVLESETLAKMGHSGRIVAENAYKLKDMREKVYGYYSETIPKKDTSRFPSVPLPMSTAVPLDTRDTVKEHYSYHVPGQRLSGNMIHRRAQPEKAALAAAQEAVESKKTI